MKAEICEGEYFLPSTSTQASPLSAAHDLVGDELLVLLHHRIVVAAADQALHGEDGALRVGDRLALGRLADKALAVGGEGDDRGRGPPAFRILDHLGALAVHDGDARIGRAEVDADDFRHFPTLLFRQAGRTRDGVHHRKADALSRPPTRFVLVPRSKNRFKAGSDAGCGSYKKGVCGSQARDCKVFGRRLSGLLGVGGASGMAGVPGSA